MSTDDLTELEAEALASRARIAELEAEVVSLTEIRDQWAGEYAKLREELDGLANLWPCAPEMIGTSKGWNEGFVAGLEAFRASVRRTIDEIRARPTT